MSAPAIASGMAVIEELPPSANEVRKLMWICTSGHYGIAPVGYRIVCRQCCHGGDVPQGFTCNRCGESGRPNTQRTN